MVGCFQIIGDLDTFIDEIKILSNSSKNNAHKAISELISERKILIEVEFATTPDLKSNFWKEY